MRGGRLAIGAAALLWLSAGAGVVRGAGPSVPEPPGYRLDDYRAPVPDTVAGGVAIGTDQARTLWARGQALFIDVLPAQRRPPGLSPQAIWRPLPRMHIPGSLWLPDVGRGALAPRLDAYFRDNLTRATHGNFAAPVVFYCLAECWMSWNAAKRAASYGYTHVYWYRDGTDGWTAAHLPTAAGTPVPGWP